MREAFDSNSLKHAHRAVKTKWELLRDDLANGRFSYENTEMALGSKFLSEFDALFMEDNRHNYYEKSLIDVFNDAYVVRGAIINHGEPDVCAERFIPKSEYMVKDNRFSPKGVEWLYLALGYPKDTKGYDNAQRCSQAECHVKKDSKFAICEFALSTNTNSTVIDLTIGEDWGIERLKKEMQSLITDCINAGIFDGTDIYSVISSSDIYKRFLVNIYASIMSEELFVRVDSKDESCEYAPFHCIAQYFLKHEYNGIIYKSVMCSGGKNMVLFDKNTASPIETSIKQYYI